MGFEHFNLTPAGGAVDPLKGRLGGGGGGLTGFSFLGSQLTKVRRVRDQLEEYLKIWQNQPPVISLQENPPYGLDLQVAQYELHSMDDLEEKLGQFPTGTKFILATSPTAPSKEDRGRMEFRKFLRVTEW